MGWFGRRGGGSEPTPGGIPDPDLPALDAEQGQRFRVEAMAAFRRRGVETICDAGVLEAIGGVRYPLHNISAQAAAAPERDWPRLLDHHAAILLAHEHEPVETPEQVAGSLYLGLWQRGDLPFEPDLAIPLADDLLAVPARDFPETVKTAGKADQVDVWGGWEVVRQQALRNLAGLRSDETMTLGDEPGSRVLLSIGGYFNASRLLVLERVLSQDFGIELPPLGALVAVPNRSLLAIHVPTGPEIVAAISGLLNLARGESTGQGGISPHVYYWRQGRLQRISHQGDEGTSIRVEGMLGELFTELGLLE